MNRADEDDYREFVKARLEPWRRMAYLLCRDWHAADDLVAITIGKLYRHWRKARAAENVDAYARGVLTHAWLDEMRRPWRREDATAAPPDTATVEVGIDGRVADREALHGLLLSLGARQRAVVVLRYYCDLSVEQTAEILGISTGTVKSQAARGLETLRSLAPDHTADGSGR
ncbi:MAG TPA: SigE family RNA polymerase sigma factor [Pilimelia sp.]|nr:SigE family RNA polymerase sigma factor [Pilimelia sp.]